MGNEKDGLLELKEAASLLGVGPEALKMRILRGTMRGKKVGKKWNVFLEDVRAESKGGR